MIYIPFISIQYQIKVTEIAITFITASERNMARHRVRKCGWIPRAGKGNGYSESCA